MAVLLHELEGMELPAPASAARGIAMAYWLQSSVAVDALRQAKEECWVVVDSLSQQSGLDTILGRRTRAVLCVLEPSGDDEARSMIAEWFANMMGRTD